MRAVSVQLQPTFSAGVPTPLFDDRYLAPELVVPRDYDVSRDGTRLLKVKSGATSGGVGLTVVVNWVEELKRLAPTN